MSVKKVFEFIKKHNMLLNGETVLAAVSGGADSVCMLHFLCALSKELNISVCAAHFNHMLRGAEADRDEAFVKDLCSDLHIPFYSGRGDVAAFAKENGMGTEEAARTLRYEFLKNTAVSINAAKIATAHNADDNAETVILNLTRGTGLAGLRGIPPVRGNIIRPILCLTRDDVEEYLKEHSMEYVIDSSNLEDIYTRNKLRHNVMPVLRELNPRFSENLLKSCDILRQDEAYISAEADRIIKENAETDRISTGLLLSLPKTVSSRIIRKMAGIGLSASLVDDVLELCENNSPSAKIDLPGLTVRREYGDLVFGDIPRRTFSEVSLTPGESALIPELNLEITLEQTVFTDNIHKSFTVYLFKTTDVYGKISIRPRTPGDKLKLRGTDCTKTVKKLFTEKRIPAAHRELIPVIADDKGVLGIYKLGCDVRGTPVFGDTIYIIKFKEMSHI